MKKDKEYLWVDKNKKVISCDESNKILNENFYEVKNIIQNSFDDAILMGCDENDFKKKVSVFIDELKFSIGKWIRKYHY